MLLRIRQGCRLDRSRLPDPTASFSPEVNTDDFYAVVRLGYEVTCFAVNVAPLRRSVARVVWVTSMAATFSAISLSAQTSRQGLLSLEDGRIFYEVIGSGSPIVVIHGGPGLDHNYLQPGLDILASRNTLVYYDQRGTGRSEATLAPDVISLDTFVDDVDVLRQTLEYEKITLLSHSFGALIALGYASKYPLNVNGLVLMNPVEPGKRFSGATATRQSAAQSEQDVTELERLMASEGFRARDPATVSQVYRASFRSMFRDRGLVDELELNLSVRTAQNGQEVARLLGEDLGAIDWWGRLPEIQVPTLIVHGRYDIPPVAMSRALADVLPLGLLAVLESGHFPYVEDQVGLVSTLARFLAELPR